MISSEIQHLLNLADESHKVANSLVDMGMPVFQPPNRITRFFIWLRQCCFQKD
jgi:hypothetical protein